MFQVSCFMFQELMIAAFTPSFLQKEVIWFEENLEKIRQISKTNPYWKKNVLFLKDGKKIARMETLKEPADQKTREKIIKEAERKKESAHLHNIKPGAFLTHLDHGIGIFRDMSIGSEASQLEQKGD